MYLVVAYEKRSHQQVEKDDSSDSDQDVLGDKAPWRMTGSKEGWLWSQTVSKMGMELGEHQLTWSLKALTPCWPRRGCESIAATLAEDSNREAAQRLYQGEEKKRMYQITMISMLVPAKGDGAELRVGAKAGEGVRLGRWRRKKTIRRRMEVE